MRQNPMHMPIIEKGKNIHLNNYKGIDYKNA